MKKNVFIVLFLFVASSVFSDGFNGVDWGAGKPEVYDHIEFVMMTSPTAEGFQYDDSSMRYLLYADPIEYLIVFLFSKEGTLIEGAAVGTSRSYINTINHYSILAGMNPGKMREWNPVESISIHEGTTLQLWDVDDSWIIGHLFENDFGRWIFKFSYLDKSKITNDEIYEIYDYQLLNIPEFHSE